MKKLLLVDDDVDIRNLYKIFLAEKGNFEVTTAGDGLEGLEQIKNNEWDVILLDVQLPRLNGIDILKTLKSQKVVIPPTSRVFLLTNLGNDEIIEEAREFGVVKVLVKARYRPSELVDEINKVRQTS